MMQSVVTRITIVFFDAIYRLMQGVVIAAIVGALGNALYAFVQSGWSGLSKPETWFLIVQIRSHPLVSSIIVILLILLFVTSRIVHQQQLHPPDLSVITLRRVEKFRLDRFPIGRKTPYLSRLGGKLDHEARAAVCSCRDHRGTGVVFVGRIDAGKTRLAYEVMRATLHRWYALIWPSYQLEVHEDVLLRCHGRKVVLFLDDLQRFAEQNMGERVVDTIGRLRDICTQFFVIATMRTEDEEVVLREMGPFLRELTTIEIPDVSDYEKHWIIDRMKERNVPTYPQDFNGTFGSLIQGLVKHQQVYRRQLTLSQQTILKSIKLLDTGYIFPFSEQRVRVICQGLFEVSLSESSWRADINVLCKHDFVCPRSSPKGTELSIQLKPIIFRHLVVDYPEIDRGEADDLRRVREIFLNLPEPDEEGIRAIEIRLSADQREQEVQRLQHEVFVDQERSIEWAELQYKLGAAFLVRVRGDREENIEHAVAALQASLEVFTRQGHAHEWGKANLLLCQAYHVRTKGERQENLNAATAHGERALQVLVPDAFPQLWATLRHPLDETYLVRSAGKRRATVEKAITFYEAAMQVYTREVFPEQWAMIQNNIGRAYVLRIEGEKGKNIEQAVVRYKAVLELYTREAFPEQWAMTQNNLGNAYLYRIWGERRSNIELAITYHEAALHVYTHEAFPEQWAMTQNDLGRVYSMRIMGEKQANVEKAIACYELALQVYTPNAFPEQWALTQRNLGNTWSLLIDGKKQSNVEQAIACYTAALQVYSREAYSEQWAMVLSDLGRAYIARIRGQRQENVEQAIAYYTAALQVYTHDDFPEQWAMIENNLGQAYTERVTGDRRVNLEQAVAYYKQALRVYTLDAFPRQHRDTQSHLATAESTRGHWQEAHLAYVSAMKAEALLIALGAGVPGRDAILKEGGNAAIENGFALVRLSRIGEAAVSIERGRARGLAESITLDAASPSLILDLERRSRYEQARYHLISAQAALNRLHLDVDSVSSQDMTSDAVERIQRERNLQLTEAYYQAKAEFDSVFNENQAEDPSFFMDMDVDEATILWAAEQSAPGHAIVYLAATSWGGVAVGAFSSNPTLKTTARFGALDLPQLTDTFIADLIEKRLPDGNRPIISSFAAIAQAGDGFNMFMQTWSGETFRDRATALHTACEVVGEVSTFDLAAQQMLQISWLAELVDVPLTHIPSSTYRRLAHAMYHYLLHYEHQCCLEILARAALRSLAEWLQHEGVTSCTLIPCGLLAAFPLLATEVVPSRTLADLLVASVAPSARSLLGKSRQLTEHSTVYALGDPHPTRQELEWAEAEASTVAKLARRAGLHAQVRLQEKATRNQLIRALEQGYIVDLACHTHTDAHTPLNAALLLANKESLSLGDLLSHEVDMATYLLVVRFIQEWLPRMDQEPPAAALARAQQWLRTVTNRDLRQWRASVLPDLLSTANKQPDGDTFLPYFSDQDGPMSARLKILDESIRAGLARIYVSFDAIMRSFEEEGPLALAGPIGQAKAAHELAAIRRRYNFYDVDQAEWVVHQRTRRDDVDAENCPFADPIYWAGFQIIGW